jgi:hypothetical protein
VLIGKSWLVKELKDQTSHDGAIRIVFPCSPAHHRLTWANGAGNRKKEFCE